MLYKDMFDIGMKVRVFQLTTTDVGDYGKIIRVGNTGIFSGFMGGDPYRNDAVVELDNYFCLVSSCDLELIND